MNGDARVMEFYPKTLTRAESDAVADRIEAHFAAHAFGMWAVELPGVTSFIGFVGIAHVPYEAPFTPAVELGWRLAPEHWGKGYATEAARASARCGFEELGLASLVAFTVPANLRSQGVMQRLGMTRDPAEDFDHPRLPEGHPLRRHVLYRLRAPAAGPGASP